MKFRISAALLMATATLGALSAPAQLSSRIRLQVKVPVQLAGLSLAPGAYDVVLAQTGQGLIRIEDKSTLHASFVLASGKAADSSYQRAPRIEVTHDIQGVPAITALYFPEAGLTYRFEIPRSRKEGMQSARNGSQPLP